MSFVCCGISVIGLVGGIIGCILSIISCCLSFVCCGISVIGLVGGIIGCILSIISCCLSFVCCGISVIGLVGGIIGCILSIISCCLSFVCCGISVIGLVGGIIGDVLDLADLNRLVLGRLVERRHRVKRGVDPRIQAPQEPRLLSGEAVIGLADDVLALSRILEIEVDRIDHEELVGVVDGRTDTNGVAHIKMSVSFHEQREIHGLDVQCDLRVLGFVELLDAGLHEIVDVRDGGVLEDLLLVAVAFHGGGGVEHITGLEDVGVE